MTAQLISSRNSQPPRYNYGAAPAGVKGPGNV
jgi:hypothetical protein